MPAYRLANLDRPSWRWSPRDRSVFRIYANPTRRAQELREKIVPAYRSGVPVTEIAVSGEISRQYVREVRRFRDEIGNLQWASIQDHMCEPAVINGGKFGREVKNLEAGALRHPLFGNRGFWYRQRVRRGFASVPLRAVRPHIVRRIDAELADIKRDVERG